MQDADHVKETSQILEGCDRSPLFKDWTESQWREVAGQVLVIGINRHEKSRRVITHVKKRDEFDVAAHRQLNPGELIQFMQLPAANSIRE